MNRYMMIHRLRGPAFLLLVGILALLAQAHIFGWSKSWPLFLILWGVILLAERAALASEGDDPQWPYSGPRPGIPQQDAASAAPAGSPEQPVEQQTASAAVSSAHNGTTEESNSEGDRS
jgi:hypothetical protein